MLIVGVYYIFNYQTGEWEPAPDDWKLGDPLPGQEPSSSNDQDDDEGNPSRKSA